MADYTTVPKRSNQAWIIGAIVVVLVLLYIAFAGGTAPTGDATLRPDGTPAIEPAAVADPAAEPAPATAATAATE